MDNDVSMIGSYATGVGINTDHIGSHKEDIDSYIDGYRRL